ncbi:MAG: hypothetical protein ACJ779_05115 [Chloroflexota bacterium]
MSDAVIDITLVAGFAFIVVAGSRLGAGSHHALVGLFGGRGSRDWPTGVQEADAPRFAIGHLDGLRPGQPTLVAVSATEDERPGEPRAELIDLGCRRIDVR